MKMASIGQLSKNSPEWLPLNIFIANNNNTD